MSRLPVKGIRYFKCDTCGAEWDSKSRDCYSRSGEMCENPDCDSQVYGGCHVTPHGCDASEELEN